MKISINGKFVEHIILNGDEPEFDRGYGAFETIRTYNGSPFHLDDHLSRLRSSAGDIGLEIKEDDTTITRWVNMHCTTSFDQRIKLIAAPDKIYILSKELVIDESIYKKGVSLKLTTLERQTPSVKSISYLQEYLAHKTAVEENYYDALLMNAKQEVLEAAYANFYYVKDDVIYTSRNGILQGITRGIVIQLAGEEYQVKQGKITLDKVLQSHECFITQTTRGVIPVTKIDNRAVAKGKPGTVTKHLMELYQAYTER